MTQPSSGGSRGKWACLLILLTGSLVAALLWFRPTPVVPPLPDLSGADPEVAERVQSARQEVLAAPRKASRWGHLGMVFRAHAFGDEANFCFEQAERLDPGEARWPYYRGLTLVLTDPREGLACLRRAAERLGEEVSAPRFRLIEVLLEQGELEEAAGHLERIVASSPEHPRAAILLGRLALARQDWKSALAQAEVCLGNPAVSRQAHLLAAEACRRLGQAARAEEHLRQAGKLPPDPAWPDPFVQEVERLQVGTSVQFGRAEELMRQGQVAEAVELLEGLVRDSPREAAAHLELGKAYLLVNRFPDAERALAQATSLSPDNVDAWFRLGVARVFLADRHRDADKRREAVAAFRQAVRLKPDHVLAYHNLAVCLRALGETAEARKAWEDALRCQPDYAPAREGLADLLKPKE